MSNTAAEVASDINVPVSIVERIKKLLALAGNNSNPNEAAAAAARAAELMQQYKLEEAQLRVETSAPAEEIEHTEIYVKGSKFPGWKGALTSALRFLGVNPWIQHLYINGVRNQRVRLFGRKSAVAGATYIFEYFCTEIDRLASLEARSDKAYRNSFRLGAATAIYFKLGAAKKAQEAPSDEKALAIIAKDDEELDAAWDAESDRLKLKKRAKATCSSSDGFQAGKTAGERMAIPGAQNRAGLGSAPRQIGGR